MEVEINKRTVTVDAETVPTLAALLKAERLWPLTIRWLRARSGRRYRYAKG